MKSSNVTYLKNSEDLWLLLLEKREEVREKFMKEIVYGGIYTFCDFFKTTIVIIPIEKTLTYFTYIRNITRDKNTTKEKIEEFNKNKITDEFQMECKKTGKLFGRNNERNKDT